MSACLSHVAEIKVLCYVTKSDSENRENNKESRACSPSFLRSLLLSLQGKRKEGRAMHAR
jgi:hypothetical protein